MSIGASRISQHIGHSGKSSLVNISSLSNSFSRNLGHQKGSFQNEVQIGFMISTVIFTVFFIEVYRSTVIYGKQADNSLLKVIGNSPFYDNVR